MKSIKNKNEIKKHFCSVTKKMYPSENMIRFVLFPDNKYTIDLNYEFQGKEFFIFASKSTLARIKDFVGDIYEKEPQVENLVTRIDSIIVKRIVSLIALARKSGNLIFGFERVKMALKSGDSDILFHANNGSPKELKRIKPRSVRLILVSLFSSSELGKVFNRDNVAHSCVLKGGLAKSLILDVKKLEGIQN